MRPTVNDIEENSGEGAIAESKEEDGFPKMMGQFDQDKEEAEDTATEDGGNQEQEEAPRAIAPRIPTTVARRSGRAHADTPSVQVVVSALRARKIKGEGAQEAEGNRKRDPHSVA